MTILNRAVYKFTLKTSSWCAYCKLSGDIKVKIQLSAFKSEAILTDVELPRVEVLDGGPVSVRVSAEKEAFENGALSHS